MTDIPKDWDELYPSRFIKGGELGDKRPILTIADVQLERLPKMDADGEELRGVVKFREVDRGLVLNKTNGLCLKAMFGRVPATWIGKRIVLFKAEHKGEPCVRIYGSPDISEDREIEIKLPKRRPLRMVMHAPRRGPAGGGGGAGGGERPPAGG